MNVRTDFASLERDTIPGDPDVSTSTSAVSPRRSVKLSIRPAVLLEISRIAGLSSFAYVCYRFHLTVFGRKGANTYLGKTIKQYLLRLGPLYIKAGQVLATQAGWLDDDIRNELRSLFSNVPPEPWTAISSVLERRYGADRKACFELFDQTPIAAGSVAQVHRARLQGGRQAAVKIVRPQVLERLTDGVNAVLVIAYLVDRCIPALRKHRIPARIEELVDCILNQADMRVELQHQQAISNNFKNHPYLRVPEPITDLCHSDILVMEFVEGIKGESVSTLAYSNETIANRLQDVFYTMVFHHGLYHLDPHPGNFIFKDTGEITLLDFGLVGQLSEQEKWQLSAFYFACVRREWDLAVKRFTDCFVDSKHMLLAHWRAYANDLVQVLQRHFEQETQHWSTMTFIDDAIQVLGRHGAFLSTRFSQLALAFLTGEGFITLVNPQIDIWKNARKFTDRASPYMSDQIKARFDAYFAATIPKTLQKLAEIDGRFVAPTHLHRYFLPSAYPLIVKKAEGCRIWDIDDNVYVDLSNGYGPHILGYSDEHVSKAIVEALSVGNINALANEYELKFAEAIAKAFGNDTKVILANSGTESVLMAIRLARTFTGKARCAKFEGHYHGFSDQGLVSSWFMFRGSKEAPDPTPGCPGAQNSVVNETLVLQYGSEMAFSQIERSHTQLACIICEPMPAGLARYDTLFLQRLRDYCDKYNIVLIFDEVVTGFRVTYGGVQHLIKVTPDLTCLGKIIGGGLPCGAVVGKPHLIDSARTTKDPFSDTESKTFVGGTLSGNALTSAAGLAVLNQLAAHPEIYDRLDRMTASLTAQLRARAEANRVPMNIKGEHSIFSMTFDYHSPKYFRDRYAGTNFKANIALAYYMRQRGIYMPELHTMMLSDAHTDRDLTLVADAFETAVTEMASDGLFVV